MRSTPGKRGVSPLQIMVLATLLAASGCAPIDAAAQAGPHRTLQIQDGTVYIDGNAVPADTLPDTLALDGVQLQYQVYGLQEPVVRIQGHLYRLAESTLQPVTSADAGEAAQDRMEDYMQEPASPSPTSEYMQMLRAQSQMLYEAVQREYALEQAAAQRAHRIQQLPPGDERAAHLDTLRQTVTRLFDLKQSNRQRELEQLEKQVEEMRHRMRERAVHREAMIEQRIRQLTSHTP